MSQMSLVYLYRHNLGTQNVIYLLKCPCDKMHAETKEQLTHELHQMECYNILDLCSLENLGSMVQNGPAWYPSTTLGFYFFFFSFFFEILNYWISELWRLNPDSFKGPIYNAMKLLVLPDYISFSIVTVLALCCTLMRFKTSKASTSMTYSTHSYLNTAVPISWNPTTGMQVCCILVMIWMWLVLFACLFLSCVCSDKC